MDASGTFSNATVSEPTAKTPSLGEPTGAGEGRSGTAHLANEAGGIVPQGGPAGTQQGHIAGADFDSLGAHGRFEMLGRDLEILGKDAAVEAGDIEQDAAAQNGGNGIDREPAEAGGAGLQRSGFPAPVQAAAAGEMAQGIDVRPHVAPQGKGFGGGAIALRPNVLAMLFNEREEERRMAGVVRACR